ncbi:hypothetical protein C8R46DRAFT_1201648 [Mycena filopes]|nr:hypothetical protein C8R46DRAFT_1201648 [Mycena filopes]
MPVPPVPFPPPPHPRTQAPAFQLHTQAPPFQPHMQAPTSAPPPLRFGPPPPSLPRCRTCGGFLGLVEGLKCEACLTRKQEIDVQAFSNHIWQTTGRRGPAPRVHLACFHPYGTRNVHVPPPQQRVNVPPPPRANSWPAPGAVGTAPRTQTVRVPEALQALCDQVFGPPIQVGSAAPEFTATIEEVVEEPPSPGSDDEFLAAILAGGSVDPSV